MPNALRSATRTRLLVALITLSAVSLLAYQFYFATRVQAVSTSVVISQVYGGGGNAGATYKNDFIELFNRGASPVSLNGWSVQYASAAGTSWQVTALTNVTLQPGQYYLVQEAAGTGGTVTLPTPDASASIAMSATAGKVALANNTTAFTVACPSGGSLVDFVGFGGANCFEGVGPTAVLTNTTAALRANDGCTDTDNNSSDFATGSPTPRNTASPLKNCGGTPTPTPTGTPTPTPTATPTPTPTPTPGIPGSVVVSQVYGGGGCGSAGCSTYNNDYIEIFNRSSSSVSLNGWSVQYASAAGTSWTATNLTNVTLQPGQYYLVQESGNLNGVNALPTPDATANISMAAGAGKVLVASTTTPFAVGCPSGTNVIDVVGYGGTATCSETSPAPAPSTTTADLRAGDGCTDTNNNSADFSAGAPTPRNTASPTNACLIPIVPSCPGSLSTVVGNATSANVSATDDNGTVTAAAITSAAVPGITLDNFVPAASIGGTATATLNVANSTAVGSYNVTIQYSNDDSPTPQTATCTVVVTVNPPPAPFSSAIKISQVYGGGGNSGSTYKNDFIELYNTSSSPVDISGWSVQYTGPTDAFGATRPGPPPTPLFTVIPQGSVVQPGHYFLIQESQGAGGTTNNPTPDLTGGILVGSTAGKVALVASATILSGTCPVDSTIVDFVGYNPTASCAETTPTAALTNTTAVIRKNNGCTDTDNNANDFLIDGPIPRNSSSPANHCGGDPTQISGIGIATPDYLLPSSNTLLKVNVSPATLPPSTGITVNADLTSIGGSASQQFYDDATHGDQFAGDNTYSFQQTIGPFIATGVYNIVATLADAQARAATAPITITVQSPTCGVERWSVKTGGDPDAGLVDLNNTVSTTIAALRAITPPVTPPDNARVAPAETTVYKIRATMTLFKLEGDVDYHIVVQDENGNTMVTEIPCPCCVAVGSPFAAGIAHARQEFDARFTATSFFQAVTVPVEITGVGFFDFIHGQTGVAPNGIELHPILDITFLDATTTTLASSLNPSQYGQSVMFTATVASSGANIPTGNVTFKDGATVVSSSALNGSGQASFTTTSLSVGSHSITASYPGDSHSLASTSTVLTQVVNKADQLITFDALPNKTYGDPPFTVSATGGGSANPVTFSASGNCTSSGTNGSTITITGAGSCTVTASQAGDGNYNPALDVLQSFDIAMADQTIVFGALANKTYGDSPFTVSATGGASGNAVTFAATGNCTSSGVNGSTITITGGGSCTVTASQAGNLNYNAAPDVSQGFTISQAAANITVNGYSGVYDGNAHGATGSATGVNGEDLISLLNLGSSFTDVPGGTAHWTFAGNSNYAPSSGDATITITKATASFSNLSSPVINIGTASTNLSGKISLGSLSPTGSVSITLNGVTQNATIQAGGNFSSSFATGALAAGTYSISYSYGGDGNFNTANGSGTLTVGYVIVALYDQTKASKSGSTIPIKLEITDANGNNLSSAGTVVTAVGIALVSSVAYGPVQDSGDANPDNNFRFSGGSYIFNLQTTGLGTGVYNLYFTVGSDPTLHTVQFQIR